MNKEDPYKTPESNLINRKKEIATPSTIKVAYILLILWPFISVGQIFLNYEFDPSDIVFEFSFIAIMIGLNIFLFWLIYSPLKERSFNAYSNAKIFFIIISIFLAFNLFSEESIETIDLLLQVLEAGILLTLMILFKLKPSEKWFD